MKAALEDELTRRGVQRQVVVLNGMERSPEQLLTGLATHARLLVLLEPAGGTIYNGVLLDVWWDVRAWDLNEQSDSPGRLVWKAIVKTQGSTAPMHVVLQDFSRDLVGRLIQDRVLIPGQAPKKELPPPEPGWFDPSSSV